MLLALAIAPSLVGAVDITVTGTTDTADAPDMCTGAATVSCPSLRAAIRYANETSPDPDTITLPAGTYTLSIDGVDETWSGTGIETDPYVAVITPDATQGDLDITDSLTVTGEVDVNGYLATTITWDVKDITDPNVGDRIFHVQAPTGATLSVAFSNLILTNGSVGVIPNTNCDDDTNPYDIERIPGEFCNIWQFRRYGGALALGPGAGIAFYEEAIHGPDTPGGGGKKPPDIGPGGDEGEGGVIADATVHRVAVISNAAGADAGGIYNAAPTTISESVISGNFSGANGGGLYNDAELTINKTTIGTASTSQLLENVALLANPNQGENGGGMFDTGFHTTTITASAINGNTAIGGGGIAGRALIVFNISNTTISGNVASDVGGGITTNGTINLNSSTVVDNEASTDAPGGGAGLNSFGSGTYNMHNSIVANNLKNQTVDSNCGCSGGSVTCQTGRMVSLGYNLENADTCDLGFTGDLVNTNPQILALANNGGLTETHALPHTANGDAVNSPAVDAGDNKNCLNNDQRGSIRPADGNLDSSLDCDIGAFELYIPTADLHFDNMTAPDEIHKGDTLAIQAEVHNTAQDPAANVVVVTTFPAELTSPSATFSVDGGTATDCTPATNEVTCAVGSLGPNLVVVVNLSATASTQGSYSVSSEATTTTSDPNPENNTASVTTRVIGDSDMQIQSVADQSSIDIGDNVTITATLSNAGPDDASNVRVGTTVPTEVTLVSSTPSAGTCDAMDDDRNVACDIGGIANGATATVVYVATVANAGSISWDMQTNADQVDNDTTNNTAAVSFTGIANSDLDIAQTVNATSIDIGDNVTLTATLNNAGPQDATNVLVTTTVPNEVTFVSATPSAGTCSAMDANRNVTCAIGELVTGTSATVTFIATVAEEGSISWTSGISADQNDPDTTNNTVQSLFTGIANADLQLTQTASAGSLEEGSTLNIRYLIANAGPQSASNTTLSVTLPSGWAQSNLTTTQGTCNVSGSVLTCNLGDLAVNGDATVAISGTVNNDVTVRFSANVTSDENDPDTSNNETSVNVKFEKDENFFERTFGCTIGSGQVFDPTLLFVVIVSLLYLARKELKVAKVKNERK
ncbi:choice-of-anchor Q domain-containing protein [Kaarinaea lacus]